MGLGWVVGNCSMIRSSGLIEFLLGLEVQTDSVEGSVLEVRQNWTQLLPC